MKILFGSIVTDARGRLNGHVFKKTAFGNSITKLGLPRSRHSWQCNKAVARNSWFLTKYSQLTTQQKMQLAAFAQANPLNNSLAQSRNIGGRNMFTKLSQQLYYPDLNVTNTLTLSNEAPSANVLPVSVVSGSGAIMVEVTDAAQKFFIAVYAQGLRYEGQMPNSSKWRRLYNIEVNEDGLFPTGSSVFEFGIDPSIYPIVAVKVRPVNLSGWGENEICHEVLWS